MYSVVIQELEQEGRFEDTKKSEKDIKFMVVPLISVPEETNKTHRKKIKKDTVENSKIN